VFTVSTINVNGLRAAARKGYLHWLAASRADVVCLQEIRADPQKLPDELREPDGWRVAHAAPRAMPGRCGVAIMSRRAPTAVRVGFGSAEFDGDGRYLEVDLPGVTVGSVYLVNGTVGTPSQDAKERFMARFLPYLAERREKAAIDGREVLVCGDWNIAHREVDIKSWKANRRNSGFLPNERAWLDELFADAGYVDVVRSLHPEQEGPYSWWSYRGRAFDNDAGWRIDYIAATRGIARTAKSAVVDRAPTWDARWSDHAPVTVAFDWSPVSGVA
jgi:exodeoxyribonuclease III